MGALRRKLTYWRRTWCAWRGHPQAEWSPLVWSMREPDRWDGEKIIEGDEITVRSWRCALHDKEPA